MPINYNPKLIYRRSYGNYDTLYVRDAFGHLWIFTQHHITKEYVLRQQPSGLGPVYNRLDFNNNRRFNAFVRNQSTLEKHFNESVTKFDTGWFDLPQNRYTGRRPSNQGMSGTMTTLTGKALSATEYAKWYIVQPGPKSVINTLIAWEWCHLRAHSMAGPDNEHNIVAAVRGNNSEQLAIENIISNYRREKAFKIRVSAAVLDSSKGKHIGNVIRYEIGSLKRPNGIKFIRYLDCLYPPPKVSAIHYYDLCSMVAKWANKELSLISRPITTRERAVIRAYKRKR